MVTLKECKTKNNAKKFAGR